MPSESNVPKGGIQARSHASARMEGTQKTLDAFPLLQIVPAKAVPPLSTTTLEQLQASASCNESQLPSYRLVRWLQ